MESEVRFVNEFFRILEIINEADFVNFLNFKQGNTIV